MLSYASLSVANAALQKGRDPCPVDLRHQLVGNAGVPAKMF
jgi:hypothetical protein